MTFDEFLDERDFDFSDRTRRHSWSIERIKFARCLWATAHMHGVQHGIEAAHASQGRIKEVIAGDTTTDNLNSSQCVTEPLKWISKN